MDFKTPGFQGGGEGWVGQQQKKPRKAAVFPKKKVEKKENESLVPLFCKNC